MKQLSRGELKDILVLQFAGALLQVSTIPDQEGLIYLPNGKNTQRVKRRAEKMKVRLGDTFAASVTEVSDAKWLKQKLDHKLMPLLRMIKDKDMELYAFSHFLLYVCFSDNRQKPLSDKLKEYAEPEQYLQVIDLVSEIVDFEATMYEEAVKAVKFIKS